MTRALQALGLALFLTALGTTGWLAQRTSGTLPAVRPGAVLRQVARLEQPRTVHPNSSRRTRPVASPHWLQVTAARTGIPLPAMRAYADAELVQHAADPSCHLGWTTLAGLGWVESHQGGYGATGLRADGRPATAIIGPALTGRHGFGAVPATRLSRRLDGDPRWAHAVGPMQFLPSTWARWGVDADHDGVADPQDIDDAALSAARYLCASGDLADARTWPQAVLSYNHSSAYVWQVYDAARTYAQRAG